MTEVLALYDPVIHVGELRMRGHATGSEQVCAAASGLVYALAGTLLNDKEAEILEQEMTPGKAVIRFYGGRDALAALKTVCIGLLQLEKAEPSYIKTKISQKIFS